jgi:hypothetical protein
MDHNLDMGWCHYRFQYLNKNFSLCFTGVHCFIIRWMFLGNVQHHWGVASFLPQSYWPNNYWYVVTQATLNTS